MLSVIFLNHSIAYFHIHNHLYLVIFFRPVFQQLFINSHQVSHRKKKDNCNYHMCVSVHMMTHTACTCLIWISRFNKDKKHDLNF